MNLYINLLSEIDIYIYIYICRVRDRERERERHTRGATWKGNVHCTWGSAGTALGPTWDGNGAGNVTQRGVGP